MENAIKALLMAAAILISLMILSVFVFVFREGGKVGEKYDQRQNQGQIELFNSRFEDFQRDNNTISDIISVANLANDANEDAAYNSEMSVTIEVNIDGAEFCVTPIVGIERNYMYLGEPSSITPPITDAKKANLKKIYLYDFMNIKKEELRYYIGTPPQKTGFPIDINGIKFEDGDSLSKVDNEMDYKYLFRCKELSYHNSEINNTGRVSYMYFEMYPNAIGTDEGMYQE